MVDDKWIQGTSTSVGTKKLKCKNSEKTFFSIFDVYLPKPYPIHTFDSGILIFRTRHVILRYQILWLAIQNDEFLTEYWKNIFSISDIYPPKFQPKTMKPGAFCTYGSCASFWFLIHFSYSLKNHQKKRKKHTKKSQKTANQTKGHRLGFGGRRRAIVYIIFTSTTTHF